MISVYGLLVLLFALAGTLVTQALAEARSMQRTQASFQALYFAEAGLDEGIVQFRSDPSWPGGTAALNGGSYAVTVEDLGDNRFRLISQGTSSPAGMTAVRSVESILEVQPDPLFPFVAFGDQKVTMSGNAFTDSYNSSLAPYDPAKGGGTEGDIGTNATSAGGVTLSGEAQVGGDAFVGTGGDPGTVISLSGNATISGAKEDLPEPEPMTPKDPGALENKGDLSLSKEKPFILPGGTYLYDDISISGQGRLEFTGPATLYLSGQLSISGKGIGTSGNLPPNLIIYLVGDKNVSLSGDANFYGAVYAPLSQVSVSGNGALYGAVVGREVSVSGTGETVNPSEGKKKVIKSPGFHYDEALREIPSGSGSQVNVLSWREPSS